MEDKNHISEQKINQQIIENKGENQKIEPLIEYDNGWTVEDTMALYPNLTREEAIIAHRMGW